MFDESDKHRFEAQLKLNQDLGNRNAELREAIKVFLSKFPAHWADGQNMMKHTNIEVESLKPLYAVISKKAV